MRTRSLVLVAAVLAALAGCGPRPPKHPAPPAPKPEVVAELGWLDADTPDAAAVTYRDAPDAPGFTLACLKGSKILRAVAAMPVAPPPAPGEHASLQLGPTEVSGPVSVSAVAADEARVAIEAPLTPQLLIALGDAKTARLAYRDGSADTGVDETGKIVAFAQRCARLTGVQPAL